MSTVIDVSAEAIDSVVDTGLIHQWADVLGYKQGTILRISRWDTDGAELVVRTKDVRRAVRRVGRETPEALGLTTEQAARIRDAVRGAIPLGAAAADDLIQIAAMGRAQYQ